MHILRIIAAIFTIVILYGCNRNSLELAPITTTQKSIPLYGKINGHDLVEVDLYQWNSAQHDTVSFTVKNSSGAPLTNIRLIIEGCKASTQNYDNCNLQYDTTIVSLGANDITSQRNIFIDRHLNLVDSNFNVYVISYDQSTSINSLKGVYTDSVVAFRNGSATTNYAYCNGYVQPDGLCTFRFKVNDSAFYNISKGSLYDTPGVFARLTSGEQISAFITQDTVMANTAKNKIISLKFSKKLADSSDNIFLNLKNN